MTQANITNEHAGNDTQTSLDKPVERNNSATKDFDDTSNCSATDNLENESTDTHNANDTALNQNEALPTLATKLNVNKIESKDTLLKYVYKRDESKIVTDKGKGHPRNSLKRRKRSEDTPQNQNIRSPGNFDYTTVHDSENRAEYRDQPVRADVIKSADLADYNIETLHFNSPTTENSLRHADNLENTPVSKENGSQEQHVENTSRDDETSEEQTENKYSSDESKVKDSRENYDKSAENTREEEHVDSESRENSEEVSDDEEEKRYPNEEVNDKYKKHSSYESTEKYEPSSSDNSSEKKNQDTDLLASKESSFQENSEENQSLQSKSHEDTSSSNESDESPPNPRFIDGSLNATSEKFTSDREPNPFLESSIENTGEKSQTHINDDEVKPVIELNNEENSDELSKEIRDSPHSLPLLNNGKEINNYDFNKNEDNVKQQFERIPLNYKHKVQEEPQVDDTATRDLEDPNDSDKDEKQTKPKPSSSDQENFDKHLNFKFDDVSIKLPDIKLPEDILDYAYEPIDQNEDEEDTKTYKPVGLVKKWPYYTYKPEPDNYGLDLDVYNKNRKSKHNDKIIGNNEESENSGEDDNDEDLYEKFVRERFGKRGSFEKRSQKLKIKPEVDNQELFNTIQNVLKRTEDIQKEADKSADPNAKYLWTLEYGEKL